MKSILNLKKFVDLSNHLKESTSTEKEITAKLVKYVKSIKKCCVLDEKQILMSKKDLIAKVRQEEFFWLSLVKLFKQYNSIFCKEIDIRPKLILNVPN